MQICNVGIVGIAIKYPNTTTKPQRGRSVATSAGRDIKDDDSKNLLMRLDDPVFLRPPKISSPGLYISPGHVYGRAAFYRLRFDIA